MSYSHSSIYINEREVQITDIISDSVTAASPFETETFSFLKKWLGDEEKFALQTSGSTGTPKKISLTRNQLKQSALRTLKVLGLSEDDTALICLDTKYIAGKMMLVRALEGNLKIVAVEPSSNPLTKTLPLQPDFVALVPLQLEEIFTHDTSVQKLNHFKSVIVGGATVRNALKNKIIKLKCSVYATYGMTETVSHIALQRLNGPEASDYFTVLPGISISTDERACLIITLPEFSEPVATNDLIEIIDHTKFLWLGRYDTIINTGGIKLMPESIEPKIELAFSKSGIDQSFFISGSPDERLGEKVVLIVEGNLSIPEDQVLLQLKQYLPPYEVPKQIFRIPKFILTETGKINRLKTLELLPDQLQKPTIFPH